ncbi:nucleotidyltransferase [Hominisplanchenecus murintestinalis]|uniref:nucleotidyltransferase domain-containing protein n=1 Tax=Hominisplanchenecus murintestinalis TaxID=2941517 RepID=UPI00203F0B7C|nr:nucleotidyltransferase [Hominisplanchenecus murintestinalis]
MESKTERQNDILSIIRGLDISPTLYDNAVEKYETLGNFLNEHGLDAEIYPQGSFAFGTVVRPSANDSSASYDLDFICQVNGSREEYSPDELRDKVESVLKSSKIYADRLKVDDKCFTIKYADEGEIGFSIDIVPAVDESPVIKSSLALECISPELLDTSIAIPQCTEKHSYRWITNNPKGLRSWFDNINAPYLDSSRKAERLRIFEENKAIFESVEEIPDALERSALQRVIQILKSHRNNYYAKLKDGKEIKPISAIITVAVAEIAENYHADCTVFELLDYALSELSIYAEHQRITESDFQRKYGNRNVFSHEEGKWYIENPANPRDNLADQWNVDARIPNRFFKWIEIAREDIIDSLAQKDDKKFRLILENGFGDTTVLGFLGEKYCRETVPQQINPQSAARPYRI